MKRLLHRLLYRVLPLEGYLRVVSALFFLFRRLGLGRHNPETEYVYHLARLVKRGDTAIDIGANLGYYAREIATLVGREGHLYAVEPVEPVRRVLERNLRGCEQVEILPYALGEAERSVAMGNDSVHEEGYMGTGRNFVNDGGAVTDLCFSATLRRGSELFGHLTRLDFIKCDIEGYEWCVMQEMRPVLERHHPTVLIETGGENRPRIIDLFTALGYRGYILEAGTERPLDPQSTKDIIFRYGAE